MVYASLVLAQPRWNEEANPYPLMFLQPLGAPGKGHRFTKTQSRKHLHMQVSLSTCIFRTGSLAESAHMAQNRNQGKISCVLRSCDYF